MHQSQYLSFADKIEIVFNGLLEAARRHGELDGILCRQTFAHCMDKTAAKAVTAAHTIDQLNEVVP